MRIAVISDIHGNHVALEAVLADIRHRGADAIYCLGDVAYKGPEPAACLDRIRELAIPTVYGNTERWLLDAPFDVAASPRHREVLPWCRERLGPERLDWIRRLPFSLTVDLGGQAAVLVHGSPRSENEFVYPWLSDADLAPILDPVPAAVVLVGHHHHAFVRRVRGKLLVGPGSAGFPFDGDPRASYALLEATGGGIAVQIVRVPYDIDRLCAAVDAAGLPDGAWFKATAAAGQPQ